MSLEFAYLADCQDAISIISKWHFNEWGHLRMSDSTEHVLDWIEYYPNRDEKPWRLFYYYKVNWPVVPEFRDVVPNA